MKNVHKRKVSVDKWDVVMWIGIAGIIYGVLNMLGYI